MISEILPPTYLRWLPEEITDWDIKEQTANCSNCVMACEANPLGQSPYEESLKCCTFHPFIPNYFVGEILSEGGEGKETVLNMIRERAFVLPIGITASPLYQFRFRHKSNISFGRQADLLCPFFNSSEKNCNIWENRNSECLSFHCVSDYEEEGEEFWSALNGYINHIEMYVSQQAMLEKGFFQQEIESQLKFLRISDDQFMEGRSRLQADEISKIWLHHQDNLVQYFYSTAQWASDLDPEQLHMELQSEHPEPLERLLQAKEALEYL